MPINPPTNQPPPPPPPPPEGTAPAGDGRAPESDESIRQAIVGDGLKAAATFKGMRGIVEQATAALDNIGMALAEGWWHLPMADARAAAGELAAMEAAARRLAEASHRAAVMYRAHTAEEK